MMIFANESSQVKHPPVLNIGIIDILGVHTENYSIFRFRDQSARKLMDFSRVVLRAKSASALGSQKTMGPGFG